MRLATLKTDQGERAFVAEEFGLVPVTAVGVELKQSLPEDLFALIETGALEVLKEWYRSGGKERLKQFQSKSISWEQAQFGPLYRRPRKIWGIGLNYKAHAADLSEKAPETEPASFMKPDTTIIGPGDTIQIPLQSEKTTAEAELGVIIGRQCRNVKRAQWLDVVAGFTTIIDMTAEDILRRNPRYLTRSKSFDTFFSFGPVLVTPDEVPDVLRLNVATVTNGRVHATNVIANMTFPPDYLVSFHSEVMTMLPGDVISTGTPGAVPIAEGDKVECRIDGFPTLANAVKDLKLWKS
ncbi:MAG: fumarylacetoacetate hydrolase family protein [Verrucomicrobiota bacterium]